MIQEWVSQLPVLVVTVAILFLPGLLALRLVGLRGIALVALAPAFGVAATAVIALAFGLVRIPWTLLGWAITMAMLMVVATVLGRWAGGSLEERRGDARRWLLPTALAIGVTLTVWRLASYIHDPSGISQTNDAVFHLNAVRFILATGDASSLHVNAVIGGDGFYPGAWHAIVALIVVATGAQIPIAANMLTLAIGGVIWTVGIAWLARAVTRSTVVSAFAAVMAGALQAFPLLMFQWGVLYPNALSTALLPAAVALVVTVPRWTRGGSHAAHAIRVALLLLVAVAALLLSQPAGILPWAMISMIWLTFWAFGYRSKIGKVKLSIILGLMWMLVAGAWLYLAQSTSGSHWPPFRGKLEVFLDVLLNGQVLIPFAYGVSALMLLGLLVAFRQSDLRWFVVAWLGVSALYVLVAAVGMPLIRVGILGAWYADPYRIAALAPVVVIPLAAIGLDAVVRRVVKALGRNTGVVPVVVAGVAVATIFMVVLIIVRPVAMPAVTQGTYDRDSRYVIADDTYLNPDERELLENLTDLVSPDARVLGNPSTGSGFGYFLSGVDVYPRTWAPPRHEAWTVIAQRLRDAAADPAVCEALALYGYPQYVLDFGPGESGDGRYTAPGMTDFAGQPGFELVGSVGDDASLWRITACAQ